MLQPRATAHSCITLLLIPVLAAAYEGMRSELVQMLHCRCIVPLCLFVVAARLCCCCCSLRILIICREQRTAYSPHLIALKPHLLPPITGAVYHISVYLPAEYPFRSPSIGFRTRIFHPNIDERSGSVCLDVINQAWSPMYGLHNVFDVFLPQLLTYGNAADPLNGEAAALMTRDPDIFKARVKEYTAKYCTPATDGSTAAAASASSSSSSGGARGGAGGGSGSSGAAATAAAAAASSGGGSGSASTAKAQEGEQHGDEDGDADGAGDDDADGLSDLSV